MCIQYSFIVALPQGYKPLCKAADLITPSSVAIFLRLEMNYKSFKPIFHMRHKWPSIFLETFPNIIAIELMLGINTLLQEILVEP